MRKRKLRVCFIITFSYCLHRYLLIFFKVVFSYFGLAVHIYLVFFETVKVGGPVTAPNNYDVAVQLILKP